jgi:type I restriction enzyme S subunit
MTKTEKYLYDTENKITDSALKNSNTLLVPEDSILLSMYGTIGKVVINKISTAISQNIAAIIPNRENVDAEFLHYALKHYSFQFKGAKIITLKHLDMWMVKNTRIPLPHLREQRAIVGVLGVVDSVIAKTGEVIAKTERLKKGLMQTLLTRGIGHKEFKETEIGKIPKEWLIAKIEDLLKDGSILEIQDGNHGELHPRSSDFVERGVPFITATDIKNGKLDLKKCKFITNAKAETLRVGFSKAGDILLTHKGSIGLTALVQNIKDSYIVLSPQVTYYRVDPGKIDRDYLYYAFQAEHFQRMLKQRAKQSTRDYISILSQRKLKIILPDTIAEQRKIASILLSMDKKLEFEIEEQTMLKRIKLGLMDLLLTGKIRVKVD